MVGVMTSHPAWLHCCCQPAGAGCEAFLTTSKAKAVAYLLVFHQADPDQFWLDTDPGRGEVVDAGACGQTNDVGAVRPHRSDF